MLLAIDTSTQTIGIALYDDPIVVGENIWRCGNHHTVELTPAVQQIMKRCGVLPQDLSLLVVALGPGTFTGLRIGLAFAKGLALALHLPIIGIPTFDYLAAAQPLSDYPMAVILPAGRTRLAVGWFSVVDSVWQSTSASSVMTPEELSDQIQGPTLLCGELSAEDRQTLGRKWKNAMLVSPAQSVRHPAMLAELGWKRAQAGQRDDPALLSPIYLHIAEAIPG
ncbi:MAG: tRNA (adenosine(37)-N6)-threonylcarbamoyltransferase complex dimerization subunit type 1 TsaB [Chloroflexi bacterium]|nr:tRNA (adenosine(37)-N6)-threonylcarbamoyltransferase complex dimerization subunit type 1 TsaB [Chloroflexota bacterium]